MTKIKIRSNPYNREISYLTMDEATGQWVDVRETDERSRLRETDSERSFLPFKIKEIITIIIKEYYVGREKVQLYFEGTQDEYYEVEAVCESDDVKDKIELIRTNTILENARFIKGDIKEVFERVNPVIENIMKEDFSVKRGLNKVSQALDDVIPLCVFGNYSAGKSTFINALIGVELLPSGGDPVTAKIYEIRNSEFFDQAKISFEFHGERIEISIEGKSNTVYHMLDRARKQGVKFLVVEPAKGEYKNVFGGRKDVTVLGTNPKLSQLLRINPFSFPENIHVLEHMDRLVEIFNVCWPMYAAMPAVLKNAVEKSYVDCGWDIVKSENKYGEELYPSFADVARNVKEIIDSSEYDAENKGAYKGSLLTRLQSLCNGINGMIFVADEIPKEQLFEENVIVDLSRVGSSETKSLIMGMMVLKLQEYRMSSATGMNAELNHITVLEEAHNLLRRTSNEQSAEGSNLLGKSVEMLSNAIAEMRTYGEGFIIADQAPGLMDMSVIRNTNTKIILRLPDQADRELVGRAANLNEDQITELAKLPCGVAAVYQNEWIQPVLCKVDLFAAPEKPFMFDPDDNDLDNYCKTEVEESLLNCIMEKEILRRGNKTDLKALKSKIIKSKLETCVKRDFMEYLEHDGENAIETLRKLIYDFLSAENAIIEAKQCNDIVEWTRTVVDRLNPSLRAYPNKQIDLALALILYEQTLRDASYGSVFCKFTEVYKNEGGVF